MLLRYIWRVDYIEVLQRVKLINSLEFMGVNDDRDTFVDIRR
jgi:hypothetical protein